MILLTNGSSWTWGGGLFNNNTTPDITKERNSVVWPYHLANLCDAQSLLNLSEPGCSNQRMCRTTLDYFLKEYNEKIPIFCVIQFTTLSRYEYYLTENIDDFENKSSRWVKATPQQIYLPPNPGHIPTIKKINELRFSTYTEIEGMYKHINECSALAYLFDRLNVPYIFWNNENFITSFPEIFKNYFKKFKYYNLDNEFDYKRISQEDHHPSILGHKQLAEIIYNIMQSSKDH